MGWSCGVCGEPIPDSDPMFVAPRYLGEGWEWPCVCSLCGAPMHSNCFTRNPLDPKIAHEIGKARAIRVSQIAGYKYQYYICGRCKEYVENQFLAERAEHLEKEGRHEDLAELYEAYGDMERASEARAKKAPQKKEEPAHKVRRPAKGIDEMLGELSEKGLSVYFYCPHCASPIVIGGKDTEALHFCGHCGRPIDPQLVAEKVRAVLG